MLDTDTGKGADEVLVERSQVAVVKTSPLAETIANYNKSHPDEPVMSLERLSFLTNINMGKLNKLISGRVPPNRHEETKLSLVLE